MVAKEIDKASKRITGRQKQSGGSPAGKTRTIGGPGIDFEKKFSSK